MGALLSPARPTQRGDNGEPCQGRARQPRRRPARKGARDHGQGGGRRASGTAAKVASYRQRPSPS
eukprot:5389728-Alexandrium_andersonii.AAC.1